jgi:hypothetical protein
MNCVVDRPHNDVYLICIFFGHVERAGAIRELIGSVCVVILPEWCQCIIMLHHVSLLWHINIFDVFDCRKHERYHSISLVALTATLKLLFMRVCKHDNALSDNSSQSK